MLPDFFIVGHAKSGTTALYDMLRVRPGIFMSQVKETWYFTQEMRVRRRRGPENPRRPDRLESYEALFDGAKPEQRVGEATPSYLVSHHAADRIATLIPDAQIIAVLREPASFLRSLHMQFLRTDVETVKDLRRAIELEAPRAEGKQVPRTSARPQSLQYSDHVRYVEQLERYREAFGRERMMVLIYEDFRADNEGTVRELLRFLDVEDQLPISPVERNPATGTHSPRLQAYIRSLYKGRSPASRAGKAAIKAVSSQGMRHNALSLHKRMQESEPPAPNEAEVLELRRRYKPEVVALSEYLGRDLVEFWGYDKL
jgi:hypothetical protein